LNVAMETKNDMVKTARQEMRRNCRNIKFDTEVELHGK